MRSDSSRQIRSKFEIQTTKSATYDVGIDERLDLGFSSGALSNACPPFDVLDATIARNRRKLSDIAL